MFRGQKVTLMGLGLLGRGVGDAAFFARAGAKLTVTDLRSRAELQKSLAKLRRFKNITYHLSGHRLGDFTGANLVVRGAGVPPHSPYVVAAREAGVPVLMSTTIFARLAREKGVRLVGITGTKGKSTVTHLLYHILKTAGRRVWLGGNVAGVSTLALLPKMRMGDWAVLELDSWQLGGLGEAKISPEVALFTNFMDDHLNYYGGSRAKYWRDKANIFKWQNKNDCLIVGENLAGKKFGRRPVLVVSGKEIPKSWRIKLLGEYNRGNVALAARAARVLNVPEKMIKRGVESFNGVPGRLELVRTVGGVKFYNDTSATTPEAAVAALRALGKEQGLILIMGGADKNLPLAVLEKALPKICRQIFVLPGTGSDRLKIQSPNIIKVKNLKEAIRLAAGAAQRGEVVLMSPAFASFGLFKNEFERGEQFNKLVKSLR
jgi:UDP-N-acetylmuramoylalanine--D-glutamate ligase